MSDISSPAARPGRLRSWRHAPSTVNLPSGELDLVTRWLVITRAGVLAMTLTAGAAAGLLAVDERSFGAGWFALAFIGILLAHASNNLLNDLFVTDAGPVRPAVQHGPGKRIHKHPGRDHDVVAEHQRSRQAPGPSLAQHHRQRPHAGVPVPRQLVDVLGAAPLLVRAVKALGRPRPTPPPRRSPVWPLWFAAFTFTHTRRAGGLLVAGLAVAALFDVKSLGLV